MKIKIIQKLLYKRRDILLEKNKVYTFNFRSEVHFIHSVDNAPRDIFGVLHKVATRDIHK